MKLTMENRNIMKRLIYVAICLTKGGRPFRGHNESKSSNEKGLFLDIVQLLVKYVIQRSKTIMKMD